jgi:Holliday junction resolvase RusA-like endonuclease
MKRSGRSSSKRTTDGFDNLRILESFLDYDSSSGVLITARIAFAGCLHSMPRVRASKRGHVYLPHKYRRYVNTLREMLKELFDGLQWQPPYRLTLRVYKPYSPLSARYGDADNLLKTAMDVLPFDDIWISEAAVMKYVGDDFGFVLELKSVDIKG